MSRKPKKIKLTKLEKKFLKYPPNKDTWICKCGLCISGKYDRCWVCSENNRKNLAWPGYVKLCDKMGLDPENGQPRTNNIGEE